jgi:LPS-assembly protein
MLRRSAATAALVSLALGRPLLAQSAGPVTLLAGPPDQEVLIEADRLVYGWETQLMRLEGHVIARRGDGIVRAASGTLDRAHGLLTLDGGVLGVQGKDVFLADSAAIDLNTRVADLKAAVLYLKDRPANPDAPKSGKNTLILHAPRVRKLAGGGYQADDVTLTPCDCAGEPDYELFARTATLDGDRAHLSGAKLHFLGATLPLFPLSLPLTQRQWGLLAPEFGFGGPFWFTLAQPIFVPLGRSNDLTVTPGFYTGGTDHRQASGVRSVKGPRLGLEWRYAPAEGTLGALNFDLYKDLDQGDSPFVAPAFLGERPTSAGRGFGGVRGVGRIAHRTESGSLIFAVQGTAATDVMAGRDPQPYALESLQDLLRTDVGAWRARGPLTLGAGATLMQDIRIGGPSTDRRLFGPESRSTVQRLPGVFAQLAPVPLGPGMLSAETSLVQFERLNRVDPEERATGFEPTDNGVASAQAPKMPADLSRAPTLRFDLSPRLAFSGPPTLPVDLRAEVGTRIDAWAMEGYADRSRARAYALLGGSAGLPIERLFGDLLHRVEPRLTVRALSRPWQSGGPPIGDLTDAGGATFSSAPDAAQQGLAPGLTCASCVGGATSGVPAARRAYDEIDFAAPVSGAVEATASLSQSLWKKAGSRVNRMFQLDLVQDALLWAHGTKGRLGEASADAGAQLGPVGLSAGGRYDWRLRDFVSFGATASVRDSRTDEAHASFGFLRGSSSARLRAGIDELFSAARYNISPGDLSGGAGAGASMPLGNFRLVYQGTWIPGTTPPTFANFTHLFTASYETACRCAGVLVVLGFPFHDTHLLKSLPDFSIRIDLKTLGSFGSF